MPQAGESDSGKEMEEAIKETYRRNMKLLVMLPTPTEIVQPGFGLDTRTVIFEVKPLSDEEADQFLRKVKKSINDELSNKFNTTLNVYSFKSLLSFMGKNKEIFTDKIITNFDSAYTRLGNGNF